MATIVLESAKVIAAAEAAIARIRAYRKEQDEESIAKFMRPRKFLGLKLRTRTRAEAIKALDNSTSWGWRSITGWGDLDKAKGLLRLAGHGDPVTLNEEDVRVLF